MIKKLLFSILLACSISTWACWYSRSNYIDYISDVNGTVVVTHSEANGTERYSIVNNMIVDFPISVSMKLTSNDQVILNGGSSQQLIPEILRGKLQYRVLPGGDWITVEEYNTPTGTIPKDSKPANYFGKNNIWPKNCKVGDVIMIRLYVTDGIWQSGELIDKCTEKLTTVSTQYGNRLTLPNQFQYLMDGVQMLNYDLGGQWYPHLAITVIYSGKERPLK